MFSKIFTLLLHILKQEWYTWQTKIVSLVTWYLWFVSFPVRGKSAGYCFFSVCALRELILWNKEKKNPQSDKFGINGKEIVVCSCITLFTGAPALDFICQESKDAKRKNGSLLNWEVQISSVVSWNNWPFNVLSEECFNLLILSTSLAMAIFLLIWIKGHLLTIIVSPTAFN